MANTKFTRAVKKAKALYKTGRYKTFADAVKAAYKKLPGKVGAAKKKPVYKQTKSSTSNLKADRERKALPPGPRKPAGSRKVTYREYRKNRSDVPGKLTGVTAGALKSELKNRLKDDLAKQLLRRELSTTKRDKKKVQKQVSQTKLQLRKLL